MRRTVFWIVIGLVLAAAPLLQVHFAHRNEALVVGYVSVCRGDTRDHVVTLMGAPTREAHANLHMPADYEFRYTVWLPWPNEWVVGFKNNIVIGKTYVAFPKDSFD